MDKEEVLEHLRKLKGLVPAALLTTVGFTQPVSAKPHESDVEQGPSDKITVVEVNERDIAEIRAQSEKDETVYVTMWSENTDEDVVRIALEKGKIVAICYGENKLPLTPDNIKFAQRKLRTFYRHGLGIRPPVGTARAEFGQKGAEQTQTEDPYSYASSLKKQKDEKNQRKIKKPLPIVFIKDSGGKDL